MSTPTKGKHTRGFTLIEMLVAVAVLSISLVGALEALSGFSATQVRLQDRYCASLVAWKDAVHYYFSDREASLSGFSEQCGVSWEINTDITKIETSEEDIDPEDEDIRFRIPIKIITREHKVYSSDSDSQGRESARLYSIRLRIKE